MGIANRNSLHFFVAHFQIERLGSKFLELQSSGLTLKCHLFAPGYIVTDDHLTGIWRANKYIASRQWTEYFADNHGLTDTPDLL